MKIIDSRGRLFGKISLLDLGALAVIFMVIVGIFIVPGTSGNKTIAQIANTKPVELEAIVRGLSIRDPQILIDEIDKTQKVNLIIRNQPYGQIDVKSVEQMPRNVVVPLPDGTATFVPDPRDNTFNADLKLILAGKAQITKDGAVLGNNKIKIGTPIQLEGFNFDFNASLIDIRIDE